MASFSLQWRKSTSKDLRRIPREAVARIVAGSREARRRPIAESGSEKLTGSERVRTEFASATIAWCMSFSWIRRSRILNACGIGKTFTDKPSQRWTVQGT